jgi:hydrogenase expression/formation protein HypE
MTEEGKVDRDFFESTIRPHLGADRDDVGVGPTYGVDFGVVDVGGQAVVLATDPVSILPELGFDRAARFALHVVLADVAVSGVAPSHLAIGFHLPPGTTDEQFATAWRAIDEECRDLGVAVVTGHTGRYEGCSFPWVGAATALGVGDREAVVRPDGARPGDRLLLVGPPATESVALLGSLFPDRIDLPESVVDTAAARIDEVSVVRPALVAAASGPVTAMHDATERGVFNAVREVARSAGVRIDVDVSGVPIPEDVATVCDHFGMDPWVTGSAGSLLVAVRPDGVEAVRSALESEGTAVAEVGRVSEPDGDPGAFRDGEEVVVPREDPFAEAYAELVQ